MQEERRKKQSERETAARDLAKNEPGAKLAKTTDKVKFKPKEKKPQADPSDDDSEEAEPKALGKPMPLTIKADRASATEKDEVDDDGEEGDGSHDEADESFEAGRLNFAPGAGELAYGAESRGFRAKQKHMRASLRHEEETARKLANLESEGERMDVRRDVAIKKSMLRLEGKKVHDNVSKLRKTQKALDMKKKRGKQQWDQRLVKEKEQQADRQKERKENLLKRKKSKKKYVESQVREGFEGKRAGYLNKDK